MTSSSILAPRILTVDDENQIHASLRLRLGEHYDVVSHCDARSALARVKTERFDLCIVDLHMPVMDGLSFVEAAREIDPGLGFVILSGHGTEENLRRAIPLQVYDFLQKPVPDRSHLEQRLPTWIERTKQRRHELALMSDSALLVHELHIAQVERDIEFTASESARDALLQSSNLLTTINALLASAGRLLENHAKQTPSAPIIARTIQEARKAADAASAVADEFFNTAYANRDASLAHLGSSLASAASIANRSTKAEQDQKQLDIACADENAIIRGLSGIDLLLLLVPSLSVALEIAPPATTIQVRAEGIMRLDSPQKTSKTQGFLWVNRKHALHGQPGVLLTIRTSGRALEQTAIKQWLEGDPASEIHLPARGLIHGLKKCQGMLGFSSGPQNERFELAIALPT